MDAVDHNVRVDRYSGMETLHEAGCSPAIASYEGQLAFSVTTNAVLPATRATRLLLHRHVAMFASAHRTGSH